MNIEQNETPLEQRYFSRPEAAEYARVSTRTLDNLVRQGKLPCCRPARKRVVYDRHDLDAYLEASKTGPVVLTAKSAAEFSQVAQRTRRQGATKEQAGRAGLDAIRPTERQPRRDATRENIGT
jgi:excisionase family DNA binding protein